MELLDEECRLECSRACNKNTCCGNKNATKAVNRLNPTLIESP